MQVFKSSTTPDDFSIGVIDCLAEAATSLHCELSEFLRDVSVIAHGSTVATNAVLTSNGAKVGSISTKGFRDTLELRRRKRPGEWFRKVRPVEPLCPRYLSLEVDERLRYTGEIITPLDEKDVLDAIKVFQDAGVESIAVCLLFSVINPIHEIRVQEIIESEYPAAFISLSSDVLPQLREYERTSTVVLDAYVSPMSLFSCKRGDIFGTIASGGGGHGDPIERPVNSVRHDVRNGFVSIESARDDYGVVIDPEDYEIDIAATDALRSSR